MNKTPIIPALVIALALPLGACGDDDDESADTGDSASAGEVTVTATEYEFDLSATPTEETESVVLDNQGEEPHALIFARLNEGFTVDEAIELEGGKGSVEDIAATDAGPGASKTAKLKPSLGPGDYVMLCPIQSKEGPHYELGQLEEFTLE